MKKVHLRSSLCFAVVVVYCSGLVTSKSIPVEDEKSSQEEVLRSAQQDELLQNIGDRIDRIIGQKFLEEASKGQRGRKECNLQYVGGGGSYAEKIPYHYHDLEDSLIISIPIPVLILSNA